MKIKRRSEAERRVTLVGIDPVLCERVRASLRRSPFVFLDARTDARMDGDEPDLYVAPAALVKDLAAGGTPVIACGPAGLLRTAFLDGCDDYLRDPWTPEELGLRALAVLARGARRCRFPWGEISLEGQRLCTPGGTVPLTFHQTRILAALLRARGRPVPRAALAHAMGRAPGASGGPGAPRAPGRPMSRAIDVHVAALRRCMRAAVPASGRFIVCVRGQGYMVP